MKKALIFLSKWLGIGLALLFLAWFASGIVMHYVPFPSLAPLRPVWRLLAPARPAARRRGVQPARPLEKGG